MGYINATFLGKEYSIPEDVLTYIDLLDFTESIKKQLVNAFVRKLNTEIQKGNSACLDDKDLSAEIEQQVGRFIAKLCDNGIFNRTINDYLNNNKGYQLFSDVNKAALEKMRSLLIREMDSWQAGYEDALQKKESSVTGMGFSIWSSSFINHAIYAAMEASTVDKQEKAAAAQYQKDMSDLRARLNSQYGGEKSIYVHNTYIPNMEAALTVFAYELLDKYLADLIANGKFDSKTLDFVDISRSNDLLKNLTLSNNKKAILENAFSACPYNIAVYMQAMKYDLLDYDSFQTAKVFKQDHRVLSFFRESWGEVSYPTKFNINYHCINVWATLTGQTTADLLRGLTEQYATGIVKAYSRVVAMLTNAPLCRKAIEDCSEDVILNSDTICKTKAHSYVDTIVSPAVWCQLTEKCGHPKLLEKIIAILSADEIFADKNAIDNYLIGELEIQLESARQQLIPMANKKQQDNLIKAQEKEMARTRWSQQCKRVHRVCKFALPILIILPLLLRFLLVGMWCNDVKSFIAENIESQLENELSRSNSIATKMELTGDYEINGFKYYKAKYTKSITIVPYVTVYSDESDNFYSSQGFMALDYLQGKETDAIARPWYIAIDEYNPSVNYHMTVIGPDGSKDICYEDYEEDDTPFFIYMPFGFFVLFLLYSSVVVLAIKRIKSKYTC